MYSKLKVPFKRGPFQIEKELDFLFKIGTIEAACERLGVEFWQMSEADSYDFTLAILFEGYLTACQRQYKKPKYNFSHAVYWMEYMSRPESVKFADFMKELMGRLRESTGTEKKK